MTKIKEFFGIGASEGLGLAPVLILKPLDLTIDNKEIYNPEEEIARFKESQKKVKIEIELIKQESKGQHEEWTLKIFDTHLLLIDDPELESAVLKIIHKSRVCAEQAILIGRNTFISLLKDSNNEIIKERVADLFDVTNRMIAVLTNQKQIDLSRLETEAVIVTQDFSPLETSRLNPKMIKGIITEDGSYTSHTAIMARSLGIPAVTGLKDAIESLPSGELIFIDGGDHANKKGYILLSPSSQQQKDIRKRILQHKKKRDLLKQFIDKKSISKDGVQINIEANLGNPEDLKSVIQWGADGIGLFRTEFLFMESSDFPDEERQYYCYKKVLTTMNPKPVIIRTIDIGGDKKIPYFNLPPEENPFLGIRGIRYCLKNQDIFRTQLRALLRASYYGNLKIMFPMIATKEELIQAKNILTEEEQYLKEQEIPTGQYQTGVMIEIPSAALIAEKLTAHVDFFSIGSNDLIQYAMAADRTNSELSYLYQPLHPAILQLIKIVTDAAHNANIPVGVCGEIAGDISVIPTLLRMGITELSMVPREIPEIRKIISELNLLA